MVGLEAIDEIIKYVFYSAYIAEEEQPISMLLLAEAEAGKTEEVKKALSLDGIALLTDPTAFGIMKEYGDALQKRHLRHIIIPDLITPLSKSWETSHSFISFLNALIAEGVMEIRTYAMSKKFQVPVKCGVIGCITPDEMYDKRHKWLGMGFMSRLLPLSWSYGEPTRVKIFEFIEARLYAKEGRWSWQLPAGDVQVNFSKRLAEKLRPLTYQYVVAQKAYGFRYHKHLQRLAMARAIAEGRDTVLNEDVDRIIELSKYLNLGQTPV